MRHFYIILLLMWSLVSCPPKIKSTFVISDLYPIDGFDKADINAIAIVHFDASAVKHRGVDTIALRDKISYDIIKMLYEQKKIRVIQGQAIQGVQEKELTESTRGDYEAATSIIERMVAYKYNPYQKVDAVLSGSIIEYLPITANEDYHYIELIIRLVDNIDGTIYWITKIRGNYKDVLYTITNTLSNKVYTEPPPPPVLPPKAAEKKLGK